MIEPDELRLGNWINAYYGNVRIVGIDEEDIETTPNLIGATHGCIYSPIKLTPEILEKCGFDSIEDDNTLFVHNEKTIFLSRGDTGYYLTGHDGCNPYSINQEYLHHLQNLFFALTGEELQIEL